MAQQHCQECGFVNPEGANYCQRCGAFLGTSESSPGATTAAYRLGETGEIEEVGLQEVVGRGAALVIRAGGGRAGESFALDGERLTVGRRPDSDIFLDDVTVSRDHAVLVRRGSDYYLDDCGSLNGTYVNRRRIESHRLEDGDELQVGKYKLAYLSRPMTASEIQPVNSLDGAPAGADAPAPRQKAVTIGAVCKALHQEFPDISISKIRYLEDQKLLNPRRTQGGYRLYTQSDIQRLRTILRLQRDEFLPLRVIRQELATGRAEREVSGAVEARTLRRASVSAREPGALYSLDEVVEETGATPELVRELEEFGVIRGETRGGVRYYDDTEREIVRAVSELARYGVGGRNLRVFRSSADREAQLLQSILAPALRSRNPERRKEAIEALENLASVTTHLKHLLLIRDLRKIAT